eukprot:COSAG02_NODE_1805_length_10872_cov_7.969461_12_plen_70_part_00
MRPASRPPRFLRVPKARTSSIRIQYHYSVPATALNTGGGVSYYYVLSRVPVRTNLRVRTASLARSTYYS